MKLILGNVLFDFSGGEYSGEHVENILLDVCGLEDEKEIQVYGQKLLEEYCENKYGAKLYDSYFTVREVC